MEETQYRITQHEYLSFPTHVRVVGYTYLVDLGPTTQPRFHTVDKHRRCFCELSDECPAVEAVAEYLRHGGPRAPDPMPACPICGAETVRDRHWNGKYTREFGWRCTAGGIAHFLQAKAERIKEAHYRNHAAASEHESQAGR